MAGIRHSDLRLQVSKVFTYLYIYFYIYSLLTLNRSMKLMLHWADLKNDRNTDDPKVQ